MNRERKTRISWREAVPRGRSAAISLILVAVLAFFLGGFLLGDGRSTEPVADGKHVHVGAVEASESTMWTCSMHPQIQLPKPGKCPICFMDLIPVETGDAEELGPRQIRMSETAVKLANIRTAPVMRAHAERSVRMVGKLDYDETKVASITAWVPGRLERLFVDYTGARVSKGERLAEIYSPELVAAQEELLQAIKVVGALGQTSSPVLKSTAKQTLVSTREKLRLYGLSDEQITTIEDSGEPEYRLTMNAPIGGTVVHKEANEGMYVKTGSHIYTIADLSELWVMLEAYESDLPWLRDGQQVSFTSPSLPGETFNATISFIDPVVDSETRTVDVRAIVSNTDGRLKPQMFVSGEAQVRLDGRGTVTAREPASETPLLIPDTAPLITGKRAVVYVQIPSEEGPAFEGREVTLGPRAGKYYIVRHGLEEGELVVVNGAFKIDSELQIQARPSMMSPEGGAAVPVHDHGQGVSSPRHEHDSRTAGRTGVGEEVRIALGPVYEAYFGAQMALSNDDLKTATASFARLADETSSVNMSIFKGEAHVRWMGISETLTAASQDGASSEAIDAARDAFFHVSQAVVELHETFGHAGDATYYLMYCPMARNSEGARWLQKENVVWNPYYGESMLRCGEITQELPPGNPASE